MSNIKDKLIEIAKKAIANNAIMEDDCIMELDCNDLDNACEEIADSIIEKLPEILADSEWVKLPCKVGQDVWFIRYYDNKICEGKICSIINREIEPLFEINICDKFGSRVGTIGQIENIFYTQAEAETKLAKMKGAVK